MTDWVAAGANRGPLHVSGRGKTSGLDLGQMRGKGAAALFDGRGGKVTRLVFYWDRGRALADLGLSEQDAHAGS